MTVTFTLTSATSGTTASTAFNISGRTSSNVVSELATGVTKNQLTTGYTITGINDLITGGTIASISPAECAGVTTTWTVISGTPTPTPTALPQYNLIVISSGSDGANACTNNSNSQYTFEVYSEFHQLTDGDTLYADALGSTVFVGSGGFYSDGTTFGKINSSGLYTQLDNCPS